MAAALLLCALSSCASKPKTAAPGAHVVQRGETLYSIAFRHELDYREVAARNGISRPYLIYPGQRLILNADAEQASTEAAKASNDLRAVDGPVVTVKRGDTLYSLARRFEVEPRELAALNGIARPYIIYPGRRLRIPHKAFPASETPRAVVVRSPVFLPLPKGSPAGWLWPAQGEVVRPFQSWGTGKKGIGIAGRLGDPVRAASAGRVVYSGDGLIGYGQLLIIQHSDHYLSAYGHNRRLLVAEGEEVSAGQTIAELGDTGVDRPLLHFEIRRDGKPVDPLRFLPHL